MIIETKVWRTTQDGAVFSSHAAALAHDAELRILAWFDASGIGRGGAWNAREIASAVMDGALTLAPLLAILAADPEAEVRS